MTNAPAQAPIPPQRVMSQLLFGKQLTASLSALARLGVADHMGETPISAEELAGKVGAHAPSLYRVMRMLASVGVFTEEPQGKFALTPLGETLKSDAPGSMRYTAMMLGDEWSMRAYVHMTDCIRTGGDGVSMAHGKPIFDLFAERPEQAETFQRAMSGGSAIAAQSILASYDFAGIERLADLGGGHGLLLASVLQKYPAMQGVLFDLPEVVAGVPADRLAGCGGRYARGGRKLLRARAARLRRLPDEAHHPRLERRALPHYSAVDPRAVASARAPARVRAGHA